MCVQSHRQCILTTLSSYTVLQHKMVMRTYLNYAVHKSLSDETQKYIELRRNKCKNTSVVSRKNNTICIERLWTVSYSFLFCVIYLFIIINIFVYYYFILRLRVGIGGEQLMTSENRCRVYNNMKVPLTEHIQCTYRSNFRGI